MKITDVYYNNTEIKGIEFEVLNDDRYYFILAVKENEQLKACVSTIPYIDMLSRTDDPHEYLRTVLADALEVYEFENDKDASLDDITVFAGLIGIGVEAIRKNFDPEYMALVLDFKDRTIIMND